jgi:tetratricopeptide (TPR) repeat protein
MSLKDVFASVTISTRPTDSLPTSKPAQLPKIVSDALLTYFQAKEAALQDDIPSAIDLLKKTIQLDPSYLPAHQMLLSLAFENNRFDIVDAEAQKVLELNPGDASACYIQGSRLLQTDKTEEAMDYLYKATLLLEREGKGRTLESLLAAFKLGGALASQGYITATIEVYQPLVLKMEQLDGEGGDPRIAKIIEIYRPGLYLLLGEYSMTLKRYSEALTCFQKALAIPSVHRQATIGLIRCLILQNNISLAKEKLDELAKNSFDESLIEIYQKIYKSDWPEKLIEIYLPDPDNQSAGLSLADLLINENKYTLAIELLKKIRAVNPNNADAVWLMARAYDLDKQSSKAANILLDAVEKYPSVGIGLAQNINTSDRLFVQHLNESLSAIRVDTNLEYVKDYLLGMTSLLDGRFEAAANYFRNSIRLRKDFQPAYVSLGKLLLRQRKWQSANDLIDQAVAQKVDCASLYYIKGEALAQQGNIQSSIEALEKAKSLNPDSDKILMALAEGYLQNRQTQKAAEQLKRLIGGQLAGPDVLARLAELLLEAGNPEMTDTVLRQYEQKFGRDDTWQLLNAGKIYQQNRDVAAYRKSLACLSDKSVDLGLLAKNKAELEFSIENFAQAADITVQALKYNYSLNPNDYQRLLQINAFANWKLLNFDLAEQSWRELIANWPTDKNAKLAFVKMLMDAQEFAKAEAIIADLLRTEANDDQKLQLQIQLIACFLGQDRLLEALNTIDSWIQSASQQDQQKYQQLKIDSLIKLEQYADALALLDELIKQNIPPLKNWQQIYISILETINKPAEALAAIERFQIADSKKDSSFYDTLKIPILLRLKEYDKAIALAKDATNVSDSNQHFLAVLTLIDCYQNAGRFDDAIKLITSEETKLAQNSVLLVSLRQQFARTLQLARRFKEAEQYILEQIKTCTDDVRNQWQQWLISLYFAENKTSQAIDMLESILTIQPNLAWANNSLGYSLADRNTDLSRAETLIRKALMDDPGSIAYLDSLAWVKYRQGRYTEAYRYAKMAQRGMNQPDPVIYDHLGDICIKLNKIDEAILAWQHAIQVCEGKDASSLEPDMPDRVIRKLKKYNPGKK